jgi:ParB-like chromosome segregation protein Spo0J
MSYELHPLCTLFPRVTGAEFAALVADIRDNGLRQPIVLHGGMILDGGNRYRACIEAGIEPSFVEFGGGNLVSFVLSANLHRRHMSAAQQAAIVASAQNWAEAQSVGRPKKSAPESTFLDTTEKRAAQSGASVATQRRADAVAKADPELAAKVAHGAVSLPRAVEQVAPQLASRKASPAREPIAQPANDADSGQSLDELIAEIQHENELLHARLKAMEADDTKAELHKALLQRDHAVRQQSEAMDKAHKSQDREKWSKRQLMRCGKAVGEEDPDKIAAAVEAFVRQYRKAA